VKRLSSWALPIILAVAGVTLIIVGSLDLDGATVPSLAPIATPTPVAQASDTPSPTASSSVSAAPSGTALPSTSPTATPSPSPLPDDVVAVQLDVPAVGIGVLVKQSAGGGVDAFPPSDAAYILAGSSQPGRGTNSYVFAHAVNTLFKPLWNVQLGDQVLVRMSNDQVLAYVVTEVRPNVACPDENAAPHPNPPLALQIHTTCDEGIFWTEPTDHERLTLQTSQGYNRNWGELVVIAEPAG
jgi:hypothetical protein